MQLNNVFFKKCTTLIIVIRFAPNKNNQKVEEDQAGLKWPQTFLITTNMSRFLLSLRKFQQFARFNSTLML